MTETNRIEFKRQFTDDLDIEKEVIAFLNYREGGIIYIGVDGNGKPVGVDDIDAVVLKIKDRIRTNVSPSPMGLFDVLVENIDGVDVIKIFLASGTEKPYYKTKYGMSARGCYIRIGTASEPMPTAMIEDLFAHRVRNSLRNIPSPRQKLTFRQLHIYYESKGLMLNSSFEQTLDLLTNDGRYNYVAFLLADENNVSIKVAKYSGTDRIDLISNNEYGYCSLLKATDLVLDKLNTENYVFTRKTEKFREDKPMWDRLAVREAVINAIVHNDYTNEVPPKFEIFSDRLEITSYGTIPMGLSEDEFFSGVSLPRNKELMRVFRDVEMVEALGSGMPVILRKYGRESYSFLQHFIRLTIPVLNGGDPKNVTKNVTKNEPKNVTKNENQNVTKNEPKNVTKNKLLVTDNEIVNEQVDEGGIKCGNVTKNEPKNVTKNEPKNDPKKVAHDTKNVFDVTKNDPKNNTNDPKKEADDPKNDPKKVVDDPKKDPEYEVYDPKIIIHKRRDKIVGLIKANNKISYSAIAKEMGVSRVTIKRYLAEMRHIVQHVGPRNGGHWEFL